MQSSMATRTPYPHYPALMSQESTPTTTKTLSFPQTTFNIPVQKWMMKTGCAKSTYVAQQNVLCITNCIIVSTCQPKLSVH
mmetsp:Transcript_24603/g.40514  ORF Transcript_24603/g.40514 Transcript_24603/m.40514 type:complete len:81 (+) Transcript_24603:286-528(+)